MQRNRLHVLQARRGSPDALVESKSAMVRTSLVLGYQRTGNWGKLQSRRSLDLMETVVRQATNSDAFLSYTRFDDRRGQISEFRTWLSDAVEEVSGHAFEIFHTARTHGVMPAVERFLAQVHGAYRTQSQPAAGGIDDA